MTRPRSYLFVPGDSAKKITKAADSGADAIILDLEDSVAAARKDEALGVTADFLRRDRSHTQAPEYWVRLNTADPAHTLAELAALPLAPITGIVHPKLSDHTQIERLGHWLDALETRAAIDVGRIAILGIITETPAAIVGEQAATLARGHCRLRGYTWGTEDLSAAIGRPPLAGASHANRHLTRAIQRHCLMMAAAAGVEAIDGVCTDFNNTRTLAADCIYARDLGYTAKLAIHPAQLDTIDTELAPSAAAIEWAQRVTALQRDHPDAASFQLDGRMVDQPHIHIAQRILARAGSDT